jgi:hypothetical protein
MRPEMRGDAPHLDEGAEGRHARAEARHASNDGRERVRGQVHIGAFWLPYLHTYAS